MSTTTQTHWKKETVLPHLQNNDSFLVRALVELYNRQTYDEKVVEHTKHDNGVGFNHADAKRLTSIAKWHLDGKRLTPRQIALIRRRLLKYAGQIAEIANAKNRNNG